MERDGKDAGEKKRADEFKCEREEHRAKREQVSYRNNQLSVEGQKQADSSLEQFFLQLLFELFVYFFPHSISSRPQLLVF